MLQIPQLDSGSIWICNNCTIWWGSQIENRSSTNFLSRLNQASLLPPWDSYRGWKDTAEDASVCDECGRDVSPPVLSATCSPVRLPDG